MAKYSFANLDQWALKNQRWFDAVVKDAAQTVVGIMQTPKAKGGRMPVRTGKLRNSLKSSLSGGAGAIGPASYIMVAASMKGGDTATFTYTAEYAAPVNNGNRGRPGAHFVEGAADQWPVIVRQSVRKAKAAVR
jgi:hypothetical protein